MSSGCGDVLSLADLQTAKKHQLFEAEVITGLQGGIAGGAPIDYATNQATGQVQKTLPAVLVDAGFVMASFDFSSGGTLGVGDRSKVVLWPVSAGGDGNYYAWKGVLPKTIPAASSPASTGGVSNSAWSPVTDGFLRSDLIAADGFKNIGRCASVEALRATEPTINKQMISLVEYTVGTGYGGGLLWYDNTDTTSADNGVNIFVTAGGKRWKRLNSSVPTLIDAGGVPSISVDSSAALTRLVAVGNAGHIPEGSFSVKGVILSRSNYTLTCAGTLYLGVRASTSEINGGVPGFVGMVLQDCNEVSIQTRWHGQRALQPAEEHIYCLAVAGGSQIDIDLDAQEVAGDGLYVSQSNWLANSTIPSHVSINARVRNSELSGRNAVSIISLDNFSIKVDCTNVGGVINSVQQPGGLDLEPNQTYQTITNGTVEVIADNCAFGFCIFGKAYNVNNVKVKAIFSNNCKPYLTRFKNCDIDIQNKDSTKAAEVDTCLDSKIRIRHYDCTSGAIYGFNGQVLRCDIETTGVRWADSVAGHYDVQSCTFKVVAQDCTGTGTGFAFIMGIPNGQTSAYVPAYNRYSIDCPRQTNAVYAIRNANGLVLSRCILCNSNLGGWNNWGEAVLGQVANIIESTICNGLSSSNAAPGIGYYPQGHIVRANSNTITTGRVLYGWLRLTTGNSHIPDTDWKTIHFIW